MALTAAELQHLARWVYPRHTPRVALYSHAARLYIDESSTPTVSVIGDRPAEMLEAALLAELGDPTFAFKPDGPNCPKCGRHDYPFICDPEFMTAVSGPLSPTPCREPRCPGNPANR